MSNLIVFPATITIFLLGKSFTDAFTHSTPGITPFIPPLVGDFLDPQRFGSIIGLGIILMAPEAVARLKNLPPVILDAVHWDLLKSSSRKTPSEQQIRDGIAAIDQAIDAFSARPPARRPSPEGKQE